MLFHEPFYIYIYIYIHQYDDQLLSMSGVLLHVCLPCIFGVSTPSALSDLALIGCPVFDDDCTRREVAEMTVTQKSQFVIFICLKQATKWSGETEDKHKENLHCFLVSLIV